MKSLETLTYKLLRLSKSVWSFLYTYRKIFLIWFFIILFVVVGYALGLSKSAIAFLVLIFGLISQAFIGLLNLIALVPIVGPIIAKVLMLPIYWILNAVGYFLSLVAIKKGHSRAVLHYRILTIIFLIGVAFGFVIGRLV